MFLNFQLGHHDNFEEPVSDHSRIRVEETKDWYNSLEGDKGLML
jgi:hypothetical protein